MAPFAPLVTRVVEIVALAHRKGRPGLTPDDKVRNALRVEHFTSSAFVRAWHGAHFHIGSKHKFKIGTELHRVDAPISARRINYNLFRAGIDCRLKCRS